MEATNVIEMRDVRKAYGTTPALRGVDFDVAAGEVVCVLGPNGAGKSTAIGVMLGQRRPSSGSATLFGLPPRHPQARGRVGVMLQESGIPEALNVAEVIRLFRSYYPRSLPQDEVLERADLRVKRDARVRTLSGGQRRRLEFALAIAGDPDVIFLDEPTVAMDVEARRAFWEQVREFASYGKTIVFSTHHLEEADAAASRVLVIHEGRVLADGAPDAIKRRVAARTVRLRTNASAEWLASRPGVKGVEPAGGPTDRSGGAVRVFTNEPEALLAEVFASGHTVRDLTVTDTDLETAFVSLVRGQA